MPKAYIFTSAEGGEGKEVEAGAAQGHLTEEEEKKFHRPIRLDSIGSLGKGKRRV